MVAKSIFQNKPIKTTYGLRDAVVGCFQQEKTRKIAQVFQAFRICVNSELSHLNLLCNTLHNTLNPNGLALIITFHSLERDVIYNFLKNNQKFRKTGAFKPSKEETE